MFKFIAKLWAESNEEAAADLAVIQLEQEGKLIARRDDFKRRYAELYEEYHNFDKIRAEKEAKYRAEHQAWLEGQEVLREWEAARTWDVKATYENDRMAVWVGVTDLTESQGAVSFKDGRFTVSIRQDKSLSISIAENFGDAPEVPHQPFNYSSSLYSLRNSDREMVAYRMHRLVQEYKHGEDHYFYGRYEPTPRVPLSPDQAFGWK